MEKKYERIVKTFYDSLEEGKILGRKCTKCGHVEFPPYLACNECGNLDTEWVEISGKAVATQLIPCPPVFSDPGFEARHGRDYVLASIKPEDSDELSSIVVGVSPARAKELKEKLPLAVKPIILQEDVYKMVFWQLVDDVIETKEESAEAAKEVKVEAAATGELTVIEQKVIECAAEAYQVDASKITLDTDVREELSSQSMKLVAFISVIEDELDAEISMRDAAQLKTIRDFAQRVVEMTE